MPFVIVRLTHGHAGCQRQNRLGPVQRLHLTLFVYLLNAARSLSQIERSHLSSVIITPGTLCYVSRFVIHIYVPAPVDPVRPESAPSTPLPMFQTSSANLTGKPRPGIRSYN